MQLRLLFSFLLCATLSSGFSQVAAPSIGVIGSATPLGWGEDTDMVQSLDSAHLWTLSINLLAGEAKFRQDNDWAVNWGFKDFPSGIGVQGGANIPVIAAGTYDISFNTLTGAYKFIVRSDVGLIGNATITGWDSDTDMYYDPVDSAKYFTIVTLSVGECKFRKDNAWTINWGANTFPMGVATQGGPNIPITQAGKYRIDFNTTTGEYAFTEVVEFVNIGIIGGATPGGWDTDTYLTKQASAPELWKGVVDLIDGEAKFRANGAWAVNWGDTLFPAGIGILNGPNIPCVAGKYQVSFNTATLEYKFVEIVDYATVGIIGNATPLGWDNSTPMEKVAGELGAWKLRVILTDGEAKFRANNDWAVNWGSADFPSGVGEQEGANIVVPAGEYVITFNSITGEYNFQLLLIYNSVGLIGPATPLASWDEDVDMTRDAVDESLWTIPTIDLNEGEAKFRAENAWDVNWGLEAFPTGTGKQNGPNIKVTAGTYRVTLNSASGDYAFLPPSSTVDLLKSNAVSISPNPANNVLNINITAPELTGDVQVIIYNSLGQTVLSQNMTVQNMVTLNVANLVSGNYMVQVSNGKYIVGKTLVISK